MPAPPDPGSVELTATPHPRGQARQTENTMSNQVTTTGPAPGSGRSHRGRTADVAQLETCSRSMAHRIAAIPSGRRVKYVVVVFWLAVVAVGGTMAGKLQGAEKNDSSAWLPAKAESTQALNLQARFMSRNIYPAVVVYERPSGITKADRVKAAADARVFAQLHGVHGRVTGPKLSADGKAIVTVAAADLGNRGWNGAATFVDAVRKIAGHDSPGLSVHITGAAGNAAD